MHLPFRVSKQTWVAKELAIPGILFAGLSFWFFLTGVTQTNGPSSMGSITSRVALPDLFFLLVFPVAIYNAIKKRTLQLPRICLASLILLIWFGLSIGTSTNPFDSMIEWVVNTFAFAGFVAVYLTMRSANYEERQRLVMAWVVASMILALLGLYDWLSVLAGLPRISDNPVGAVSGTFRNTGQAGAFFLQSLTLLVPYTFIAPPKHKKIAIAAAIILVVACLMTIKRASILGLACGSILFVLADNSLQRIIRNLVIVVAMSFCIYGVFNLAKVYVPGFKWRTEYKLGSEKGKERLGSFVEENIDVINQTIEINPIIGVGLAGVGGELSDHEVHSGYLGVLASGGFGALLLYFWFLWEYISAIKRPQNNRKESFTFAKIALPLVLGMMVSWIYTYHFRKREYWAVTALSIGLLAPLPPGAKSKEEQDQQREEVSEQE